MWFPAGEVLQQPGVEKQGEALTVRTSIQRAVNNYAVRVGKHRKKLHDHSCSLNAMLCDGHTVSDAEGRGNVANVECRLVKPGRMRFFLLASAYYIPAESSVQKRRIPYDYPRQ